MRHRGKLAALLLVIAMVAAACGGDDSSDTTAGTTAAPTTAAPTTTSGGDGGTTAAPTTAPPAPAEIKTDIGVEINDDGTGTIKVGLLADLSGVFSGLVTPIVGAFEVYTGYVNANGGINGLMIEPVITDTAYDVAQTAQKYAELKDEVAMISQATGSPQTVNIAPDLAEDQILAIPLTWYSGWADPSYNANLIRKGTPYCIESMNLLEWTKGIAEDNGVANPTVAILSVPGDYGLDSAAGAKLAAAALGMDVVFEAIGVVGRPEDAPTFAAGIVANDPDIVFITATPGTFPPVYQEAIKGGFEAIWTGGGPTYALSYLTGDFAEQIERDWHGGLYFQPWGGDSDGAALMRQLMTAQEAIPFDYYSEGFVEAMLTEQVLRAAYDSGDMTQAGILAAAKNLESVTFMGLAPDESYVGTPDEQLHKISILYRPSRADLGGGGSGSVVIDGNYVSDLAAGYEFTEACFALEL